MVAYVALCLAASVIAAASAAGVVARDPGLRVGRLMGWICACISYWAFCEVVVNTRVEPGPALWALRMSSFGWMSLGPLCFHLFAELAGARHRSLKGLLAASYALSCIGILLYVATPWCIDEMVRTGWGWSYHFGPAFPVVYVATIAPICFLLLSWRRVYPRGGSDGERRVSRVFFACALSGAVLASLSDVTLPFLEHHVPRFSAASLAVVCLVVAWSLRRYGFSLLSPGAFAIEILDTLKDGVALLDVEGNVRDTNPAFDRLAGAPRGALRGVAISRLLPVLGGVARDVSRSIPREPIECDLYTLGGGLVPVSLAASWLRRETGRAVGLALVARDVREVSDLRHRLVTSARLAAVGELSAGIADEINKPLQQIRAGLGALRADWCRWTARSVAAGAAGDDESSQEVPILAAEGEELIDECLEGVERVASIVADVAGFARTGAPPVERIDLAELVERAVRVVQSRAADGVRIERADRVMVECRLDRRVRVEGAPHELEQVLLNLLDNALHAVAGEGRILVELDCHDSLARIRVSDDGPGIDEAVAERIFDPFFTTKPVGEGTGLGLAISQHIVRNHGGALVAESAPGEGATLTVVLPLRAGGRDDPAQID